MMFDLLTAQVEFGSGSWLASWLPLSPVPCTKRLGRGRGRRSPVRVILVSCSQHETIEWLPSRAARAESNRYQSVGGR